MIPTNIVDGDKTGNKTQVVRKNGDVGLVALTEPLHDKATTVAPLTNSTSGADMTQSVSFGGTAEGIYDGTDSVLWTGATIAGTWDFADTTTPSAGTKCVSLTTGVKNDEATFADGTSTNMANYVAVTGKIRLDTYDAPQTDIKLEFLNGGVAVGNNIKLKNYINTALLGAYQSFVIPKADFGLTVGTVDKLSIRLSKAKGILPTFRFDTIQIEQTGAPAVFTYDPGFGNKVKVISLKVLFADNVTATSSYNAILGVASLTNGIVVNTQSNGETVFGGVFKRLIDFIVIPNSTFSTEVGAADTWMTINYTFQGHEFILDGDKQDKISFTINDDLSALTYFQSYVTVIENLL